MTKKKNIGNFTCKWNHNLIINLKLRRSASREREEQKNRRNGKIVVVHITTNSLNWNYFNYSLLFELCALTHANYRNLHFDRFALFVRFPRCAMHMYIKCIRNPWYWTWVSFVPLCNCWAMWKNERTKNKVMIRSVRRTVQRPHSAKRKWIKVKQSQTNHNNNRPRQNDLLARKMTLAANNASINVWQKCWITNDSNIMKMVFTLLLWLSLQDEQTRKTNVWRLKWKLPT